MIDLKLGYDSEADWTKCDWCQQPLGPDHAKIFFGTGNSLLLAWHAECYQQANQALLEIPRGPLAGDVV